MGFSQLQRTAPKHPKGMMNHTATSARTEASIVDEGRIFAIRSKRQQAKCRVRVKQTSHDRQSSKDGTGKFVVLFRDSASSSVGLTRTQAPTLDALTAVLFPIFLKGYDNNCRIMYIMRINCGPYGGDVGWNLWLVWDHSSSNTNPSTPGSVLAGQIAASVS